MSTILKPLSSGLYTIPKGVLYLYPFADASDPESYEVGYRIGDCDAVSINIELTETERFSNEHDVKTLAKKLIDELKATFSFTAAQLSEVIRAAALMGSAGTHDQSEQLAQTKILAQPGAYWLGGYGLNNVVVTKDGAEPAVLNTDYMLDAASGQIETFTADMTVEYDIPEVTGKFVTGIASGTGLRGMLMYRGTNKEGVQPLLQLWDIEVRPDGERSYISESGISTQAFTGTAYPVGGKSDGFSIGFERDL